MGTAIICIILIMICIFSVKSYVKKLQNGCCGAGGDGIKRRKPADEDVSHYPYEYTVLIEGMSCKNCAIRIENSFHSYEGYYAKVCVKRKMALVRTKEQVEDAELRQIITKAGYEVIDVKAAG